MCKAECVSGEQWDVPKMPSNDIQEVNYYPVSANRQVFVRAFGRGILTTECSHILFE